ncbi:hypothetical protein [Streptomyces sp. ISL-86]|uniref:hypothetical protein n=1 Tax=Streptomyces sp. ISL-86 TaxID=2819187 RepID=UPI001BE7B9AB|nr:hypothetical protein [Streptomyces sp. ISL-86]MBT2454200.1 hypothetical protein [Streptomyces sp. ISL-86]
MAAVVAVAGCSASREYAVPAEVCGVPVEQAALEPLLPPGEKLEQSTHASRPGNPRCDLEVDKKSALRLTGDVISLNEDPIEIKNWQLDHPSKIVVGDDARVADATVLAVAACSYQGENRKFVAQAFPPEKTSDVGARREAMTRFMAAYFPAAKKAVGCAP